MTNLHRIQQHVLEILTQVKNQLQADLSYQTIQIKSSSTDLVTERDKSVEQQIITYLKNYFPEAHFVSEEGFGDHVNNLQGLVFFVDPIDGTMNFIKAHDQFASMIGVYLNGQPLFGAIIDIIEDQLYYGGAGLGSFVNGRKLPQLIDVPLSQGLVMISNRFLNDVPYQNVKNQSSGLRVFGSAGISFTRLLRGSAILYISKLKPWDMAAGWAIGKPLGLIMRTIDGTPISMLKSQTVIIGTRCATEEAERILS
ncbi:inositol monophosphatase family protein [Bombilactobacillus folatiphilus]|uniref:Inositol monophosphatase family protein n=1 Tax=Bombilactobacillus folatiphilus TaxID=2923362 RepID=A0ABY4PAG1_9LACO|nr:inositol monophosphatase family protein [Bombilactobacillus folatiphilus]UQS82730.1 inositol monophosphatase family protein [Bombilactobacillus folatiphilus]